MERNKYLIPLAGLGLSLLIAAPTLAAPGDGPGRQAGRALAQLDADGDRLISLDEFVSAALERAGNRFALADSNGDGFITDDDFEDAQRPEPPTDFDRDAFRACVAETLGVELPEPREPGERLANADLDGDGAVSLDEALVNAQSNAVDRFDALDADDSGFIEGRELRARVAGARALREARRACREEQQDIGAMLEG